MNWLVIVLSAYGVCSAIAGPAYVVHKDDAHTRPEVGPGEGRIPRSSERRLAQARQLTLIRQLAAEEVELRATKEYRSLDDTTRDYIDRTLPYLRVIHAQGKMRTEERRLRELYPNNFTDALLESTSQYQRWDEVISTLHKVVGRKPAARNAETPRARGLRSASDAAFSRLIRNESGVYDLSLVNLTKGALMEAKYSRELYFYEGSDTDVNWHKPGETHVLPLLTPAYWFLPVHFYSSPHACL